MEEKNIRVMLVDDHIIVRQGMGMLINTQIDMTVAFDAESVDDAISIIKKSHDEIDILLIDISLNGSSGFELLKYIRIHKPELPALMISMHDESLYAERAINSGAKGYLMKQEASDTVIESIRAIIDGKIVLSDKIRQRLESSNSGGEQSLIDTLTTSELEILQLVGQGISTNDIAKLKSRSVKTIEAHRSNIRRKLDLDDGNALLMFAIKMQGS
jgi:DNA-binding NarL/FixJ family response regulator